MNLSYQQALFIVTTLVIVLVIWKTLIRRDRAAASQINLEDWLLGDDGRLSKAAGVMMGAFVTTTWVVLFQAYKGQLTDTIFGAYIAAWVAPTVTRLIVEAKTKLAGDSDAGRS